MQLVWLKRDLRLADHAPLFHAAKAGKCVCLFVYEPEVLQSAEFDVAHLHFINESLGELEIGLKELGGRLILRRGRMPEVLDQLHHQFGIEGLWSHEETGNESTYARDRRVRGWAKAKGIPWQEFPQTGVVRRLRSRDGWANHWNTWVNGPLTPSPQTIFADPRPPHGEPATPEMLGLRPLNMAVLQPGGESHGIQTLKTFLKERGQRYIEEMSSPNTAGRSCSRLSPYLAWGCVSIKSIVHRLRARQQSLRTSRVPGSRLWLKSLEAYQSRLSWHCHFMQKLEDQPNLDQENMNRAFDGLREDEFSQARFDAWSHGQTGFPLIDACMRSLHQHRWINFRMRAMLASFAAYDLWLDWRPTGKFLGRHFLDFEPGIHYSQMQMQSGVTGVNTLRIYSPLKQAEEQDPSGEFIRANVRELRNVPDQYLREPDRMPLSTQQQVGCVIGKHYPCPIVDHSRAVRRAKSRVAAITRTLEARTESSKVQHQHGSRRGAIRRRPPRRN